MKPFFSARSPAVEGIVSIEVKRISLEFLSFWLLSLSQGNKVGPVQLVQYCLKLAHLVVLLLTSPACQLYCTCQSPPALDLALPNQVKISCFICDRWRKLIRDLALDPMLQQLLQVWDCITSLVFSGDIKAFVRSAIRGVPFLYLSYNKVQEWK